MSTYSVTDGFEDSPANGNYGTLLAQSIAGDPHRQHLSQVPRKEVRRHGQQGGRSRPQRVHRRFSPRPSRLLDKASRLQEPVLDAEGPEGPTREHDLRTFREWLGSLQ